MRFVVPALMVLHGAIHVLGFLKWSGLASVTQLTGWTLLPLAGPGRWAFAVLWLLVLPLFLSAAALRLGSDEGSWVPASMGLGLSQLLIIFAWKDARFGTLANFLLSFPVVEAFAHARFVSGVRAEVSSLIDRPSQRASSLVEREDLASLPPPVAGWLERAGVVGRERVRAVHLKQRGELRASPEGSWMPAEATQYFVVDEPAFVWRVDATMFGFFPISGRDRYSSGKGHMLIRAASLWTIVDADDEKIAHGAMLRFLGEIVWFPSAALRSYIAWEGIDEHRSRATMRHAGLTASAVFEFDALGRVSGLVAERYLGGGDGAKLTPWRVSCSEWRNLSGVEIPVRGDVSWKLPAGELSYYRWEILAIDYDITQALDG